MAVKTEVIRLRVSEQEKHRWEDAAAEKRVSLAELIRTSLNEILDQTSFYEASQKEASPDQKVSFRPKSTAKMDWSKIRNINKKSYEPDPK